MPHFFLLANTRWRTYVPMLVKSSRSQLVSTWMDDALLTVAEVAAELKINQQTVRNWIDRRELASVRVGSRRVRVRRSALDAFLDEGAAANHGTADVAA